MHVIVGGCGRLGSEIATRLSSAGEDVVVIDVVETAFDRLGSVFNGETIVGDVTDREILERAGVAAADGFMAVTRFDNANLMSVEIATHLYGVERAVARLFNPEREASYEKLGVRYVSATGFLAKQFLNEFREESFRQHLQFDFGDVEIVEMRIAAGGHGMLVSDFEVDGRLRVSAIERGDRVFVPTDRERLERGDLVVVGARRGVHRKVRDLVDTDRHPVRKAADSSR